MTAHFDLVSFLLGCWTVALGVIGVFIYDILSDRRDRKRDTKPEDWYDP